MGVVWDCITFTFFPQSVLSVSEPRIEPGTAQIRSISANHVTSHLRGVWVNVLATGPMALVQTQPR
jgi:hypothetical protein